MPLFHLLTFFHTPLGTHRKESAISAKGCGTAWLMWCWVLEPITKGSEDNRKSGVRPLTPWIPVFQLLLYSLTLSSPPLSPCSLLGPFPLLQPHLSLCHPVLPCLPAIPLSQHCRTYFHLFVSSSPSVRSTYVLPFPLSLPFLQPSPTTFSLPDCICISLIH